MRSLLIVLVALLASSCFAQNQIVSSETIAINNDVEKENVELTLLVFSGSDWCKPCIQMKETILESEDFKTFSENRLTVEIADFPYRKKNQLPEEQQRYNEKLAEKYNQEGSFPKIIVLDNNENVLGQVTYEKAMSTTQFIKQIEIITTTKS